jgi:hypothetical protein
MWIHTISCDLFELIALWGVLDRIDDMGRSMAIVDNFVHRSFDGVVLFLLLHCLGCQAILLTTGETKFPECPLLGTRALGEENLP